MLTVGSLFAGIGGWDLGLERAGMRVLWQCEADPLCRAVLAHHWPGVPCYDDVRELTDPPPVDVICGGFPCQDISVAGRGAGIRGERSGLWAEMFRLTRDLRPRYLLVENVAALVARGLDVVLADLASIGFDAEWDCLRACDFGAPHERDRFWLVAYPRGARRREDAGGAPRDEGADEGWSAQHDHEPDGHGQGRGAPALADASSNGRRSRRPRGSAPGSQGQPESDRSLQAVADADGEPALWPPIAWAQRNPWPAEPDLARMAHGVPHSVDRRRALGNALVPQIAEWIGRRIIEYEEGR